MVTGVYKIHLFYIKVSLHYRCSEIQDSGRSFFCIGLCWSEHFL